MTIAGLKIPLSRTDLWRLGASLVLAIILWGTITAANNPERSRTFSTVDVTAAHLDKSLLIVGSLPQVSVRLSGPRSDINPMSTSDVVATLDMKNVRAAGEYAVDVSVSNPGSTWKREIEPPTLTVHVDKAAAKSFPVGYKIVGNTGSNQQVGTVTPSIESASVTGPATQVDLVDKVIASIDIGNQARDFTGSFTPVAVDAKGNPLPNVVVSPSTIPFNVQITARGKSLAVITQLNGDPAPGYEVVDRTINPSTVIVDGPAAELATLISVSTEPIEVTNATATLQKHVALVGLPAGVKVIEPSDGAVDVVVQIRQRGARQPLPGQTVTLINLGPGLTADVAPRTVAVTVVASDAAIAQLKATDVVVQVNLSGLAPGVYSVSPIVALPSNISWVSTDPPMVTVTIRKGSASLPVSPAGTPSVNATATP